MRKRVTDAVEKLVIAEARVRLRAVLNQGANMRPEENVPTAANPRLHADVDK